MLWILKARVQLFETLQLPFQLHHPPPPRMSICFSAVKISGQLSELCLVLGWGWNYDNIKKLTLMQHNGVFFDTDKSYWFWLKLFSQTLWVKSWTLLLIQCQWGNVDRQCWLVTYLWWQVHRRRTPNCRIFFTASQTTDFISYRAAVMMMLIEPPFIRAADPIPSRLITHLGADISQSLASKAKWPANQPLFVTLSCQNY